MTNYHVIKSAVRLDSLSNEYVQYNRIFVEVINNERIDMIISNTILNKSVENAEIFDFAILVPKTTKKPIISFLKLGSFKNVNEGDEILTCGYPFGIDQFCISRGLLSTKWTDQNKNKRISYAWLDLTMNSGNSGGPIIKIGNNIDEDIVIGIVSFNLNPFAFEANAIYEKALQNGNVMSKL